MPPRSEISRELLEAVEQARQRHGFLSAVAETVAEAQLEVEKLSPNCTACGKCCRFDEMDHRLFVSTGELAFLTEVSPQTLPAELRCPFQQGDKCFARDNRPMGCCLFFCDDDLSDEIHGIYEKFHSRLIELHKQFEVPYIYCEMTSSARKICESAIKNAEQ